MAKDYASNVFLNCPFDSEYIDIRNAIMFAIYDCGFVPRCTLEEDNSGNVRFDKIKHLISISKFGVHDISRTELDSTTNLPRFNMPLELGVFLGAACYGDRNQKQKNCLVLDREPYRYQSFISDIAGQDIRSHDKDPVRAITLIRNWLNTASGRKTIPGGSQIRRRFELFQRDLPAICAAVPIELNELTYNDYSTFISGWLRQNSNT